jgi:aminoglycoside phosphotransferase family enzyme
MHFMALASLTSQTASVPFEAELSFLRQAGSYPAMAGPVRAIETHMSWVFLSGAFAYKVKKPICHDSMDARSLEARHFYCEEELRLNRRLAPDVYIAVLPVVLARDGHLQINGAGAVVDWVVQMRRLPQAKMLDYALQAGTARPAHMRRIAALLAAFHARCERVPLTPQAYREHIAQQVTANRADLLHEPYRLPATPVTVLLRTQLALLERLGMQLDARVRGGHLVEGHGDLRAEHVYLGAPPAVIDCIEFSRQLRMIDCADEAGFLALECERLGKRELGIHFLHSYARCSGDTPPSAVLHFYQSVRAATRARLAIRHLAEERHRYSGVWRRRAMEYLCLAETHAAAC